MAAARAMNVPNALTVGRAVLAVFFFVLLWPALAWKPAPAAGAGSAPDLLPAVAVFVVAVVTDFLDGWLARRWKLTTAFGRFLDPLVDKVLVAGTFVVLAAFPGWGVHWAAVAIILAREFLVSGLRTWAESRGLAFGALPGGKIKMLVQTLAVLWILAASWYLDLAPDRERWLAPVVWLVVAVTVWSAVPYLRRWREVGKANQRGGT